MPSKGLLLAATLALSPVAQATNGYFANGFSATQNAMGGAGTAFAEDALIASINPAGIIRVGDRIDGDFSFFKPIRSYDASSVGPGASIGVVTIDPGEVRSKRELFPIPSFAIAQRINDWSSYGLAVYGNGGLNTVFDGGNATFFSGTPLLASRCTGTFGGGAAQGTDLLGFCGKGDGTASVDLIQLFVAPTYAVKLWNNASIGISPIFAAQRFEARGLGAFAKFSNAPDKITDNGYDFSYGGGGRIGFLTQILPGIDFGASYQSRIEMSRFKDYAGLFAEQGSFDIPSTWNLGISLKPTEHQSIIFDYQRINYSEVASVGNSFNTNSFVNNCALPRLLGSTAASPDCLGANGGPGFGWQDIIVRKIGYEYKLDKWTLHAGYSHTHQPIPSSQALLNVLAPGVVEKYYSGGIGYQLTPKWGVEVVGAYVPENVITGKNPLSNITATSILTGGQVFGPDSNDQNLTLKMHQYQLTLGTNYKF